MNIPTQDVMLLYRAIRKKMKATKCVNCTPHPISIFIGETRLIIPTSDHVVRVATPPQDPGGWFVLEGDDGSHAMIPIVTAPDFSGSEIEGLPPADADVILIVGMVGAKAVARAWEAACRAATNGARGGTVLVTDTGPHSAVRATSEDVANDRALIVGEIMGIRRLAFP